jgi:hypothetical protein
MWATNWLLISLAIWVVTSKAFQHIPLTTKQPTPLTTKQPTPLTTKLHAPHKFRHIPLTAKPHEAYSLEFLQTRYRAGCYHDTSQDYRDNNNIVSPFLYNFDFVITLCGVDWENPGTTTYFNSCVFTMNQAFTMSATFRDDMAVRVHVMGEARHLDAFFDFIYPDLEKQYDKTGKGIILHTGGVDRSMPEGSETRILSARAIVRWVVEQNIYETIRKQPKVVQLPIGLCFRETTLGAGKEFRLAMSESQPVYENELLDIGDPLASGMTDFMNYLAFNSLHFSDWKRRLPLEWKERENRVLLCYTDRVDRLKYDLWGVNNCSFCDICNRSTNRSYYHYDLWQEYRRYKFVLSPFGNGPDCFRTSEILLMGAIPIIEFFEGAYAYRDAGFKTIHIHKPEDLNEANFSRWQQEMTSGNDNITGLTREYWNRKAFAPDPSWVVHSAAPVTAPSIAPTSRSRTPSFLARIMPSVSMSLNSKELREAELAAPLPIKSATNAPKGLSWAVSALQGWAWLIGILIVFACYVSNRCEYYLEDVRLARSSRIAELSRPVCETDHRPQMTF